MRTPKGQIILIGIIFLITESWAQGSIDDLVSSVFNVTDNNNNNNNNNDKDKNNGGFTGIPDGIFVTPSPTPGNDKNNNENRIELTGCPLGYDCVTYYLCKNQTIVKDGAGLLDIRFGEKGQQCPFLEGCCAIEDKTTAPVVLPEPTPEGCGYRNSEGIGFKITGDKDNETQYGEFPWMVAILKEEASVSQSLFTYVCGGSLIHPQVVLTAAHCVDQKPIETIKVRAGEWDTQTKAELFPNQDRDVTEVVIHENYYKGALFNDIALLFLDRPIELASNVKPVCLPPSTSQFDRVSCFATGWGKDVFGQTGKYNVILKKVDLPIVPRDECQNALRTTRLGKYFELHSSFICAGGIPGKDTCKGDGGSPLVCPIPGQIDRYYQAGIVAWGIGCGDAIPGVYASVPFLRSWIDEKLAYKRIDSSFFTP